MDKRTHLLKAMLITMAMAFWLAPTDARAQEAPSPLLDAYHEGLSELSSALRDAQLDVDEENWVRRQHRVLRIRSEIQLSRGMGTAADADLLLREMRSLVHSIEAMAQPKETVQNTQSR